MPVSFREVSAPHGHDSFLLDDTDYLGSVSAFLDQAAEQVAGQTSGQTTGQTSGQTTGTGAGRAS